MGSDTADLISTLGFPVVCAAAAGIFGYKVVFYILRDLSGDIKGIHKIIIKLIDRLNLNDKETSKMTKEIAQLRCEVSSLYKCIGAQAKTTTRPEKK